MTTEELRFVEALYRRMYDRLMRYALETLGDASRAEDVVQSTFELACLNVAALTRHPAPEGWVFVTFRNLVKTSAKERAGDVMLLERLQSRAAASENAHNDETDPDVLYGDLLELPEYRLLRGYVDCGRTVAEFAETMGISAEACKKRLQRARNRLRRYFRE